MLPALVHRMIELDVEIGWDEILKEDAKGIFEMDLEDASEFADDDEKDDSMLPGELLSMKSLRGNLVAEKLDSLMVLTFLHLGSCQNSGRLAEAIMYLLCFRMRSLVDVPRLKSQLLNMPIEPILKHKLSPLKVCLPTVVEEFLGQAKAAHLLMASESFVFNDLLESDLSRAFGGMDRLDMFFPFDPCLLKKGESYIRPHFLCWSRVKTTYHSDEEISEDDSGEDVADGDVVEWNSKDMIDDGMIGSFEIDLDLNKMSITPNKYGLERRLEQQCMRMPARIRPSTSPESVISYHLLT